MGMFTNKGLNSSPMNGVEFRRQSVDSLDGMVRDDRRSIDFGRDSVIDQTDIAEILRRQKANTTTGRVRKRLNILLHTHIALIIVTVLSSLDAICVIGQVICDILIMSDKLSKYDDLHDKAIPLMINLIPDYLNATEHGDYSFEKIIEHLEHEYTEHHGLHSLDNQHDPAIGSHLNQRTLLAWQMDLQGNMGGVHHRYRRASGGDSGHGDGHEHDLLHELTHSFHIGSMAILSILLLTTFLKIFAMWKALLSHKLEIFDAFVIVVSWSLDVAFWEGIWARPGQEGATLLIFILPWRVIRIVNSFVLVIQEKDLVLLKVVKQRLRISLRKEKEYSAKLDKYRLEVKNLQGLCRKCGADENTILACCPAGRRRRSSLFQSLTSLASVALVSAMGSSPKLETADESDDEVTVEVKDGKILPRQDSIESGIILKFGSSSKDDEQVQSPTSFDNEVFKYDEDAVARYDEHPTKVV